MTETTTPGTLEEIRARYREIVEPVPGSPDVTEQLSRQLLVTAVRQSVKYAAAVLAGHFDPNGWHALSASFTAVLLAECCRVTPPYPALPPMEQAAAALRDGSEIDELLWQHAHVLGVDYEEVARLARAEVDLRAAGAGKGERSRLRRSLQVMADVRNDEIGKWRQRAGWLTGDPDEPAPAEAVMDGPESTLTVTAGDRTTTETPESSPSVSEPQESNLVKHARRELELIGEDPDVIDWYCRTVAEFASYGHSGGSAACAVPVLNKLLQYESLADLTSDTAEWTDQSEPSGYPLWQNARNSKAFSEDGGKTYWLLDEREAAGSEETTPLHHAAPPAPDRV